MGIPRGETLTVTFTAEEVAKLESILQTQLNYGAEENTREGRFHEFAQAIYDRLAKADRERGWHGI
jgi:hypothetical protein